MVRRGGSRVPNATHSYLLQVGAWLPLMRVRACDDLVAAYARVQLEKAVGKVLTARDFHEYMLVKAPRR